MKIVAVLSTTVLPTDGTYQVETLPECPPVNGICHYIGHASTARIVEHRGAVKAPSNLFPGLGLGESAVCIAISQGRSSRKVLGKTVDQEVTSQDLTFRVLTRLK